MAYFIDLFSPETYEAFRGSSRDISGFRLRQKAIAERIHPGDFFVCYMTRLSRWFGLLEVIEGPYIDSKPIFIPENDPFVVRFRVRPLILLDPEKSIPIHDNEIWKGLSFTRDLEPVSLVWTGKVRTSLVHLDDNDARFLANKMREQVEDGKTYPLDEADVRKIATHTVNRTDKVIAVSVPDDLAITEEAEALPAAETRESIQVQALIAKIGMSMGLSIWVPRADKAAVLKELNLDSPQILDRLPLNYDDTTLRTIEQIDVLWLRGRINCESLRGGAHHFGLFRNPANGGPIGPSAQHGYQTSHRGAHRQAGKGIQRNPPPGILSFGQRTLGRKLHIPVL